MNSREFVRNIVDRFIFAWCNFCPFTRANCFDPSYTCICPDTIVFYVQVELKRKFTQSLIHPLGQKGKNKKRANTLLVEFQGDSLTYR